MRLLLSVKFYAFTTAISLQEIRKKVKGKTERNLQKTKKFSTFFNISELGEK
jgi:hypothetical protein